MNTNCADWKYDIQVILSLLKSSVTMRSNAVVLKNIENFELVQFSGEVPHMNISCQVFTTGRFISQK